MRRAHLGDHRSGGRGRDHGPRRRCRQRSRVAHGQGQLVAPGAGERLSHRRQEPGRGHGQRPRGHRRRGVDGDPAVLHGHDPVGLGEQAPGAVLGEHHRHAAVAVDAHGQRQQLLGGDRVELARGLVQEQDRLPHRQHRGDRHPLLLAARKHRRRPSRDRRGAHRGEGLACPHRDLARRVAEVLEPECGLAVGPLHHELGLGVLEDEPRMPGQLARPVIARVESGHDHPPAQLAAVEVRCEAERGPQERRLARAGAADEQHELARLDLQVDAVERECGGARIPVRDPLEAQRSHRTIAAAVAVRRSSAAEPAIAAGCSGSPRVS